MIASLVVTISLTHSVNHSGIFYQTYLPASPKITLDANSLHTKTPNIKRHKQEISTAVKVEHDEKWPHPTPQAPYKMKKISQN